MKKNLVNHWRLEGIVFPVPVMYDMGDENRPWGVPRAEFRRSRKPATRCRQMDFLLSLIFGVWSCGFVIYKAPGWSKGIVFTSEQLCRAHDELDEAGDHDRGNRYMSKKFVREMFKIAMRNRVLGV